MTQKELDKTIHSAVVEAFKPHTDETSNFELFDKGFRAGMDWMTQLFAATFVSYTNESGNIPTDVLTKVLWHNSTNIKKESIKPLCINEAYLFQWYQSNVDANPPIWTDEHLKELFKDFYLIPKNNTTEEKYDTTVRRADL